MKALTSSAWRNLQEVNAAPIRGLFENISRMQIICPTVVSSERVACCRYTAQVRFDVVKPLKPVSLTDVFLSLCSSSLIPPSSATE